MAGMLSEQEIVNLIAAAQAEAGRREAAQVGRERERHGAGVGAGFRDAHAPGAAAGTDAYGEAGGPGADSSEGGDRADRALLGSGTRSLSKQVKRYDFRRPDKVSKDQLHTLRLIHDNFGRVLSGSLSGYLRQPVEVSVHSVEQMPYYEFVQSLPNPTVLAVLGLDPLRGNGLLEIDPEIGFSMLDRLLGGAGGPAKGVRELTDVEQTVMFRVIQRALIGLEEAWKGVDAFQPRLDRIELNPHFIQLAAPNDIVIAVQFLLSMNDARGRISLCLPYEALEPVMPKLSAQFWFSGTDVAPSDEEAETLRQQMSELWVPLTVQLGKADLTVRELLDLQPGDVIQLDSPANGPVLVLVAEQEKFKGMAGRHNSRVAVRIDGRAHEEGELEQHDGASSF